MIVKLDDKQFNKMMKNIIDYSFGFIDGVNRGKNKFLQSLGLETIEALKLYVDSNARVDPATLHHVYEWYKVGSPEARLFDFDYTVSKIGLSFNANFSQSKSVQAGSSEPFYNKAKIMELGSPITIKPKRAEALRFEVDGEIVYTKNEVLINNPGGKSEGGFEKVFDSFFSKYFTQAFLKNSGILQSFDNPVAYKKNFASGAKGGRSTGIQTGYRWVANVGVAS
jgi:hypothetical protein